MAESRCTGLKISKPSSTLGFRLPHSFFTTLYVSYPTSRAYHFRKGTNILFPQKGPLALLISGPLRRKD